MEIVELDPIDRLVAQLSANPLWQNGRHPAIDLPADASADQVVAKVFEMISFDKGKVTKHRIVKVKRVEIQRSSYTAALVETDLGEKVVVFGLVGGRLGWWSRVFDVAIPAEAHINTDFEIGLKKKEDKLAIVRDNGKTLFTISSPSGIGSATIQRKGEQWPESVVVRLHLRGLEFFAVSNGKAKVSAASDGKITREHLWAEGKEGPALEQSSRYWLGIRAFDGAGRPATAVPLQDGWFEITLPKALLGEGETLTMEWIDFYRG